MSYFRINTDNFSEDCSQLYAYSNICNRFADTLARMNFSCLSSGTQARVEKTVQILSNNLAVSGHHFYRESLGGGFVINEYEKTEKGLLGVIGDTPAGAIATIMHSISEAIKTLKDLLEGKIKKRKITPYEVDNIVFDADGSYGGDQGSAMNLSWERQLELWEIVKRNNPNISMSMTDYFKIMNSEGCGYVSMANVVFQQYIGREADFERDFGYPMYHDGDLNYDAMIADIYSRYDDKNKSGTNPGDRAYILQDFLAQHGIDVKVETGLKLNPIEVTQNLDNGNPVLIRVRYGNLYKMDSNGNLVSPHYIDGGHSMEVTGVTEDGYIIVSSWGEKYYVKPDEIINDRTLVEYEVVSH